jgi:hypothetical protein
MKKLSESAHGLQGRALSIQSQKRKHGLVKTMRAELLHLEVPNLLVPGCMRSPARCWSRIPKCDVNLAGKTGGSSVGDGGQVVAKEEEILAKDS